MEKRIYVASSWRNKYQQQVVLDLLAARHAVYDFRNPKPGDHGFGWRELDPNFETWTPEQYIKNLGHPTAQAGFRSDYDAMVWADEFCLVLPCGRSAHLEVGWAIGRGKRTSIYVPEQVEPELMYLTGGVRTRLCLTMDEVIRFHNEE
jgi:hypothetical protein